MTVQRSAIVTGSSRGIGAEIAKRLGAAGYGVVVNYSGKAEPAQEVVGTIKAAGGEAIAVQADISQADQVTALFDAGEQAFGGVDALINSAGIMKLAPLASSENDLVDQHLAINLKGTILGMREAARRLREGGSIVNFSSSVVGLYQPTYGVYAATKAGVEALTHIGAKELGDRKIRVNAVAPGPTATHLFLDDKDEETIRKIASMSPLGRLGEPGDIASVVTFLVSAEAGWVSGQVLRVNGGVI